MSGPKAGDKTPFENQMKGNHQYYAMKYDVGHDKLALGVALHNSYLELLLSYGVMGFLVLISFWGLCLCAVLKKICIFSGKITISYYIVSFIVLLIAGQAMLLSNIFINTTAMYYVMMTMTGYLMAETNTVKREV